MSEETNNIGWSSGGGIVPNDLATEATLQTVQSELTAVNAQLPNLATETTLQSVQSELTAVNAQLPNLATETTLQTVQSELTAVNAQLPNLATEATQTLNNEELNRIRKYLERRYRVVGSEKRTINNVAGGLLAIPSDAVGAVIQPANTPMWFMIDGSAAATNNAHYLATRQFYSLGDTPTTPNGDDKELYNFSAVRSAGTNVTLVITYYGIF